MDETLRVSKGAHNLVILERDILEDARLSFRARGLLAYLLSRADDYDVNIDLLATISPIEGREAIRTALIELEKTGYILRQLRRTADGLLGGWDTIVYDTPQETDNYAQRDPVGRMARRAAKRIARHGISEDYSRIFVQLGRHSGFRCQHCGSVEDLQIDHIQPITKGGTNQLENLQLLCAPCNIRKGARIASEDA